MANNDHPIPLDIRCRYTYLIKVLLHPWMCNTAFKAIEIGTFTVCFFYTLNRHTAAERLYIGNGSATI